MNPKDCTSLKIRKFDRLLTRQYDFAMAKANIKTTQFSLLTHIKNYGPILLTDLSHRMVMDKSTLTRNLTILGESGWVKQVIGTDARSRLVSITTKGVKKLLEATELWAAQQKHIAETLGDQRMSALNLLLDESLALLNCDNSDLI